MPRCLITGGAGFIGSHLACGLVEEGWDVVVLDLLRTGHRRNLENVADRIAFRKASVLDRTALAEAMTGVDVVFHVAAMVSVPESIADPVGCHEICATGTLNILLAAKEAGVRRVVYSASSSAYGDAATCPIAESSLLEPKSPYAAGKLAGEMYCLAIGGTSELETVRLRYFNVFGPRQDPSSPYSGVISLFCTAMLRGDRPTVFGDGLQTRDFIAVEDVVRANILAATTEGLDGEVFNVGTGNRISVLDLVSTLNELLGKSIEPVMGPPRVGDVRHSQADISAMRSRLGFEPTIGFKEGLARTLDDYRTTS
ncbi:SDR family oxidoreductase [Planctomycetes bacterium Pan216]